MRPVDSSCWTAFRFITDHPFVSCCRISGWMTLGKSARFRVRASWHFCHPYPSHYKTAFAFCPFLYPLGSSASLAFRLLSIVGQTLWGLPCSVDNPSVKCLGAPTPAVALGTANQQYGSADSGYLPFGPSVSEWFRLSCVTRFIWGSLLFTMHFST